MNRLSTKTIVMLIIAISFAFALFIGLIPRQADAGSYTGLYCPTPVAASDSVTLTGRIVSVNTDNTGFTSFVIGTHERGLVTVDTHDHTYYETNEGLSAKMSDVLIPDSIVTVYGKEIYLDATRTTTMYNEITGNAVISQ